MKNFILGVVTVIILVGIIYFVWTVAYNKGASSVSTTPASAPSSQPSAPTTSTQNPLSEQPNQAVFNEYFSDIVLMKLPAGTQFGPNAVVNSSTFNFVSGDKFCVSVNALKKIPSTIYSTAVYNTDSKSYAIPRSSAGSPPVLEIGNSLGCENLFIGPNKVLPAGNYEYKIYINNILAAVLPFKVQ